MTALEIVEARVSAEKHPFAGSYLNVINTKGGRLDEPMDFTSAVQMLDHRIQHGKMKMTCYLDDTIVVVPTKLVGFVISNEMYDVRCMIVRCEVKTYEQASAVTKMCTERDEIIKHLERQENEIGKLIERSKQSNLFIDAKLQPELRAFASVAQARVSGEHQNSVAVAWNIGGNTNGWTDRTINLQVEKAIERARNLKLTNAKLFGYWRAKAEDYVLDAVLIAKMPVDDEKIFSDIAFFFDLDPENNDEALDKIKKETEHTLDKIKRNQTYFSHNGTYILGQFYRT
jgi:hypothetical protein